MIKIRRALISVSDKTGIVDLGKSLQEMGIEIISTGGTEALLRQHSVKAHPVSEITNFPEILDGRVRTLHPKIHGALLGKLDDPHHRQQMEELGIEPIDLIVVNLYPFEETVRRNNVTLEEALEQIDIGGPTILRAAAKNYKSKAVVTRPSQYDRILAEMRENGGSLSEQTCFELAQEAFRYTAHYDSVISEFLGRRNGTEAITLPTELHIRVPRAEVLRYGENPQQAAALYGDFGKYFEKLLGRELSFNNILDIDAAARLIAEFGEPTVVIVKHNNPCGVGSAERLSDAYEKALATDRKSAFGGVVAVNRLLEMETARAINDIFTEVVIAPGYPEEVLEFLKKKKDRRLMKQKGGLQQLQSLDIRTVVGGYLVQQTDDYRLSPDQL